MSSVANTELPDSLTMRCGERNRGASPITGLRPHWSPSFPRGYPGRLLYPRYGKALTQKRSARGHVLPSSVIEVRAMLLSPSCAEEAHLGLQRFGLVLVFTAGCCPFSLSGSGELVLLECPSNAIRLRRLSHRASHGARSQHRPFLLLVFRFYVCRLSQALGKIRDDGREEKLLSLTRPTGIQRRRAPCVWCPAANR